MYINTVSTNNKIDRFFNLLIALVIREFKGQYRRSLLGPLWAFLQPIIYMAIFTFVRGVLKISSEGVPYVIFTYSALVPWSFFSNAVARCGPSVLLNGQIIKKMALPKEVFPMAAVASSLLDLLISSLILVGMMIWFHIPIRLLLIPWLIFIIFFMSLLALGVGMIIAAFGTFKRDIIFATPFLMQFWLLASPIMYPLSSVPERWQKFCVLNPMVGLIEGFRGALIKGIIPDLTLMIWSVIGTATVWIIAWPLFRSMSQYFADIL